MSTRVESPPIGRSFAEPIVIAIVVALGVGALLGAVVTKAVNDRPSGVAPARPLVATPASTPLWDAQKLEAMEGRAAAEQFRDTIVLSAAELNALRQGVVPERLQGEQASGVVLTAAELFALRNGQLAARLQGAPILWDAQKIDAMAGRVLYQPLAVQAEVAMTAKPSITRPTSAIEGWDRYKLEAMEGRVLAAQVGAEYPPVKPHLPKRPPRG